MTDAPIIRPLSEADVEAYRRLRLEGLRNNPEAFTSSEADERKMSEAEFRERVLPPPPGLSLGVFLGDQLRGMGAYAPNVREKTRHKAMMVAVYLAPELRGTGTARRLVQTIIDHARMQRVVLQCGVSVDNTPARRLYHALGFQPFGVEPAAIRYGDRFIDEELLWLDLRGPAA